MTTNKETKEQKESLLLSAVDETRKKVSSSLLPSIKNHVDNDKFEKTDGLDFLEAKNGIMLSYMIDLTLLVRLKSSKDADDNTEKIEACLARLREMKVVLEKVRPLEKKMRYQLDKLLAMSASSSVFAAANMSSSAVENRDDGDDTGAAADNSDPLAFRPNPEFMLGKDDDGDASSDNEMVNDSDDDDSGEEDDEELIAARAALSAGRSKKETNYSRAGGRDDDVTVESQGVYKAPRLAAVPFAEKEHQLDKEERMLKIQRKRMQKSEFLSTLKSTFGDAPEEDDFDGGAALGKQRETARRYNERQNEKTQFEEDGMIRLAVSRKEKKQFKKIMRDEVSNLNSIADIGNLTAGVSSAFGGDDRRGNDKEDSTMEEGRDSSRHANGKRRRDDDFGDSSASRYGNRSASRYGDRSSSSRHGDSSSNQKDVKKANPKNSFQKALFGMEGGTKKKGSKKKGGRH